MTTSILEKIPALLVPKAVTRPEDDGVTHINISVTGQTELGRKLAHYATVRFIHPTYGPFNSMEGFWYYIKGAAPDDNFRNLSPSRAKSYAKTRKFIRRENFENIIIEANYHKIVQNEDIRQAMLESCLPFDYYYLFGPEQIQIRPQQSGWLCEGFEAIRRMLKEGRDMPAQPAVDFSAES